MMMAQNIYDKWRKIFMANGAKYLWQFENAMQWGGYDSCIFIFFVVILEMMNKSL